MMEELPRAASVLSTLRSIVGAAGVIQMRDYGHGLGAVHVTLPHWLTPALGELSGSTEWEYCGPAVDDETEDDAPAPTCIEFQRWVRLDPI